MDRVTSTEALSQGLSGALLGEAPGFLEALYDPAAIEDDKLRPLVAGMMAESARLLQRVRDRLRPATCGVVREERRGTSARVTLLLNGETTLTIVVDDLYERDGALHTRDVLQIELG